MATDKTMTCRDCGASFIFTAGEQDFFASKGFTNEPSRCPDCRAARRGRGGGGGGGYSSGGSDRGGGGGYGGGGYGGGGYGGGAREARTMHTVTCSACGKEAEVPFLPRGDRPVYCSDCFRQQRPAR